MLGLCCRRSDHGDPADFADHADFADPTDTHPPPLAFFLEPFSTGHNTLPLVHARTSSLDMLKRTHPYRHGLSFNPPMTEVQVGNKHKVRGMRGVLVALLWSVYASGLTLAPPPPPPASSKPPAAQQSGGQRC